MDSILTSIKKLLGLEEDYEHFDPEIIIHINSAFNVCFQLGVGPQDKQFMIFDKSSVWSDFINDARAIEMVKTYIYLKVRLVFDPPSSAFVLTSFESQIKELEWRLNVQVDPSEISDENTPTPTPASYPNLIFPSATLVEQGPMIMETGTTRGAIITVVFSRGYIDPAYGTSGKYAGEATLYKLNGVEQTENEFSVTIDETNASFQATVDYSEGEQPKDSLGNNYDKPLSAGTISSSILNYEFVDPIWSNAVNNEIIEKEPLISKSVGVKEFEFAPQTVATPETFDIPASWEVTSIEVFNELFERYEDNAEEFDVSNISHPNAAGVEVAYKRYTDNRGYKAAERKIKITWS